MAHSKAERAEVADRRKQLVSLRRAGVRFDDPRIIDDLGYTSPQSASKDFYRALEQSRDDQRVEVSLYRQEENERLDALLEAVWKQATEERPIFDREGQVVAHEIDMKAVDTVLKLMDRRAKLNGLDMPVKAELSGPGGGALALRAPTAAELQALISTVGDADEDEGDLEDDTDDADADGDSDD